MKEGVWTYTPHVAPLARLRLANSSFTADYELCVDKRCRALATFLPNAQNQPVDLTVCELTKEGKRHGR